MDNSYLEHPRDVIKKLNTSAEHGLSLPEVEERTQKFGLNELVEKKGKSPVKMLLAQFTETMVVILIIAAVISGFLGKEIETIAIAAIVVLFAVLGFVQEYRAEKAMAALRQMSVPFVKVWREGILKEVAAKYLVPGDIIWVEAGNIIPADARVIEEANLRVQESALTGEADAVEKTSDALSGENVSLGDRINMLYMGTMVAMGRGKAVVVSTGMHTELGKIAGMIQNVDSKKTLLQRKLDQLGKWLAAAGGIAAALVMLIGILEGEALIDMFLVGISVAVAVVPEGLPAVVTITLALGSQKMLKQNALIRKLPAVESLGSVTVICSDKTGTLTENKMTLTTVETAGIFFTFPSKENSPQGIKLCLTIGSLCNDAHLMYSDEGEVIIGEPTEAAIVAGASNAGLKKFSLESAMTRVAEIPFDSDRKCMTTIHQSIEGIELPDELKKVLDDNYSVMTKGAVDNLLKKSSKIWTSEGIEPNSEEWSERIIEAHDNLAQKGIRVLGVAYKGIDQLPDKKELGEIENDLIFAGMVGMMDPPRAAVKPAVIKCKTAGIRPIMITGDYPLTAKAIAQELGILSGEKYVTGEMLSRMSDEEFDDVVKSVNVFARVSPKDKMRIVTFLQNQGEVVAMTGDGVNDSPALKKADIGVAMGITGTDVAKEASDMVLLDDNFATIVNSVEEGRTIFDNLIRFVKFSLGGNLGKVIIMLVAPLLGIVIALKPLQLLWLNLLTDGLMGLGLGVEPAEKDVMKRPPRSMNSPILDKRAVIHVIWTGVLIGAVSLLIAYFYYDPLHPEDIYWQTMLFCTIGFTQIGHALGLRASSKNVFSFSSNVLFSAMLLLTLILHVGIIYFPFANEFFSLVPLKSKDLLISIGVGMLLLIAVQIERRVVYKNS